MYEKILAVIGTATVILVTIWFVCRRDSDGRGSEGNDGGKQRPVMGAPHGHMLHLLGSPVEIVLHLLFDDQSLCGLGTGNAFVEIAGDLGVDLTDSAV